MSDDNDEVMSELKAVEGSIDTMMVAISIPGVRPKFEVNVLATVLIVATDATEYGFETDTKIIMSPSVNIADTCRMLHKAVDAFVENNIKEDDDESQRDS